MSQDWRGFINYCNPPFCLLGRVLTMVERQQVAAAVVVTATGAGATEAVWGFAMTAGAVAAATGSGRRPRLMADLLLSARSASTVASASRAPLSSPGDRDSRLWFGW